MDEHRDLLPAAQNGDESAMEQLLREFAPRIHRLCRRICLDPHDADDAAQEALIAVVRGIGRFDGRSSLSTWVHRVSTNACLDELRRRKRRPVPSEDRVEHESPAAPEAEDPELSALRSETRGELADALGELPEEFRLPVVLRDVADLEYSEISEVLGIPVGTVRSRIARGRGKLADRLGLAASQGTDHVPPSSEGTVSRPRTGARITGGAGGPDEETTT